MTDRLLDRKHVTPLPPHLTLHNSMEIFSDFFTSKIDKMRSRFEEVQHNSVGPLQPPPKLASFEPLAETEIRNLVEKSAVKSCS